MSTSTSFRSALHLAQKQSRQTPSTSLLKQNQSQHLQWTCSSCFTRTQNFKTTRTTSTTYRLFSSTHNPKSDSNDEPPAPPMLSKLKNDLKTAMRAKDKPRLNVLRSLISEINNSTKTSSPLTTDLQLLASLRKRKAASQAAQTEALDQNRKDLADKQQDEIDVIEEYAGGVLVLSEQEIRDIVGNVVDSVKGKIEDVKARGGAVMKEVFAKGGVLDGKSVEKGTVVKVVNELLSK